MKYIFLINSFSLRKDIEDVVTRINILAETLKLDYDIRINSPTISTEDILNEYKDSSNIIVSLGGDGTLNRVFNCIYGTKNILSVLPLGTGNDFSKSINEQMKNGINKVDVVKINDKWFINLVCFGIDADIANDETFVDSKIIPRSQRYNASIVTNFLNYQGKHMKITSGNDIYEKDFATVAICNGKYYGRGFIMGPHARIDDGILDVYMIDDMNKLSLINAILKLKKGKHETHPKVSSFQTNKLVIEGNRPITCNYDGEKMTSKKFDIELIPQGMDLYYNEELQNEFNKIKVKIIKNK